MTSARNIEMCRLYRTGGWSLRQLGKQYGITHEAVRLILINSKVPINPPFRRLKKRAEV